jgi:hypothetical protein
VNLLKVDIFLYIYFSFGKNNKRRGAIMLAHVDNRITYSGNGNATEFAYQFKILDRTDIKVMLTDADGKEKLLTKDYYVDVEKNVVRYPGYAVGAEVPESERPPALPTGWKLTIYREVPVTQETDLPDQYPFNQVEAIGDKLTMIAQQLTDTTDRSLKIGVSKSTDIDTVIPWENGKSFRISDDGKKLELSEDPAKVLPLAQGVYAQTQAQAQSAAASATAAAKSEDSAFESAGVAGNSAQYASLSAASAAENAELTSGYKQEALTAKADATASATNAKASEANAKISENNAEASKEAAQSAATTASNFASAARNSANEAQTYSNNAKTYMDNAKNYSENVNVFVPSMSTEGVLSWTNKAGLTNPKSVNIKGAKGDTGTAASIKIGSVTTGAAGSNASVTNSGTASNVVLNFTLPRGKDGADGGVTVDAELSDTSTNPVQNKAIYNALLNKVGTDIFSGFALMGATSTIAWRQGSQAIGSINATNYTGTAARATQDGAGNVITETYATKADINGVVKTVNNTAPDENGNVTIAVSSGDGVSTSESNTWTAQQHFHDLMLSREKYTTYVVNSTSDTPITSTMVYAVTSAFTLDLATLAGALSASQSSVFTAYFAANADYSLTISNAGKLKYVGSASDVAITSAGLLLNIWMSKDSGGTLTSIVQANKLGGDV